MALWGKKDNASNSAIFAPAQYSLSPNTVNQTLLYENEDIGAIVEGVAVGQFGITAEDAANIAGVDHAGWVMKTVGTGPVVAVNIMVGGLGYDNTDVIAITSGDSTALASIETDDDGTIISVEISDGGAGFEGDGTMEVEIETVTGEDALLEPILGGRAGRVSYETLVAMGSLDG